MTIANPAPPTPQPRPSQQQPQSHPLGQRTYSTDTLRGSAQQGTGNGTSPQTFIIGSDGRDYSGFERVAPRRNTQVPAANSADFGFNGNGSQQGRAGAQGTRSVEGQINGNGGGAQQGNGGNGGEQSLQPTAGSWGSPFPSLHLWPLNETFVMKMIHLPSGQKVSTRWLGGFWVPLILSLSSLSLAAHLCLGNPPQIKIGRQTNAKTVPGERNGYFDSKVLSRMHAEVWEEGGKVSVFIILHDQPGLEFGSLTIGTHRSTSRT